MYALGDCVPWGTAFAFDPPLAGRSCLRKHLRTAGGCPGRYDTLLIMGLAIIWQLCWLLLVAAGYLVAVERQLPPPPEGNNALAFPFHLLPPAPWVGLPAGMGGGTGR